MSRVTPATQFYVFMVDNYSVLFQTYEEALKECCRRARAEEFIELTSDYSHITPLYFPKTKKVVTITRVLFTYDPRLPLATLDYGKKEDNNCNYKNVGE